ncbi:MAG: DMT family transporter [Fusobacteriaceae bacterium]|jgi:drug/metabolite transporter (DMT)-like permease|nr:DMT family transporter [Fusobacteriaceae bacterium]
MNTIENKENKENILTNTLVVTVLASFACILWGSAFAVIKVGYRQLSISSSDTFSQIVFAGARFFIAGFLTILGGSIFRKKPLLPSRKFAPKILIISFFQTMLQYLCFYVGVAHTSGVKSSMINSLNAFISILIATLIFRLEKLTWKKIIGGLVGLAGVLIVTVGGKTIEGGFSLLGDGMVFCSGIAYGTSSTLIKIFNRDSDADPVLISGWQFLFGSTVMIGIGLLLGGRMHFSGIGAFWALLYLGALSAVAYTIWAILLKYNPVSRISIFSFVTPLGGVILSGILLGEFGQILNPMSLLALVLVCIGIVILNKK